MQLITVEERATNLKHQFPSIVIPDFDVHVHKVPLHNTNTVPRCKETASSVRAMC